MSSVSSIGNSSLNPLDPYSLQQTNGQGTTQTGATAGSSAVDTSDPTEGTESSSGHHHHRGGGGGISSQIESAVTSALQDAPDGADPNQTIQDAIASVLKQESGQSTTDPSQTATDGTTGSAGTSPADFNKVLQQHGIDPKQFQQDFQTAVKNIQSDGTVDFGALFKSFPPGAAVDTTA